MSGYPTFEDRWDSPGMTKLEPAPGIGVLSARNSRASELAGDEHTVYATGWAGAFEIDVPLPSCERLFTNEDVFGSLSGLPRLRELWVGRRAEDLSGLSPDIEKLGVGGWGIVTAPASTTLRRLWASYTNDELGLARFPNLEWLEITPRNSAAAELRAVEGLERLELTMTQAPIAKLSLIGAKDQLEYLRVYGGGLKSLEGVKLFGALRKAEFHLTRMRDFAPLADSLVEDLVIDHRKPNEDGFRGLGEMPALRRLHLETDLAPLERVADLHRAPVLESVDFAGSTLGDAVIESLAKIDTLKQVVMGGGTKAQAARLAAARPDIEIIGGTLEAPPQAINIAQFGEEWSIFGDAAGLIGAPTNYAAESKIRAALEPAVLAQLSFDTEAGMFSAQSTERAAIDAVAETIRRLEQ